MRDPNRDDEHGRIFRVTARGRPLVTAPKMRGQPIADVCQVFLTPEDSARYRARLELSGRDRDDIVREVGRFAESLRPHDPVQAQAMLECLWVFEEQRVPNMSLLERVCEADEPRVRAAAIRTLGSWAGKVDQWSALLVEAARDESALVRAEAVKTAVSFGGTMATEAVFEAAALPTDPELDTVLNYATEQLHLDHVISELIASGKSLTGATRTYALRHADSDDLMKLKPGEDIYNAILGRSDASGRALRTALAGLAETKQQSSAPLLLDLIEHRDGGSGDLTALQSLLLEASVASLTPLRDRLEKLATSASSAEVRQAAIAAWINVDGSPDDAYLSATRSKEALRDFLHAVGGISNDELRSSLFATVRPLLSSLPSNLENDAEQTILTHPGIQVDYFSPNPSDVAIETLARLTPEESGVVPEIAIDVPQRKADKRFALRFSGLIQIPETGRYRFYTASGDGSRLYIGDRLVVNNDGVHEMVERRRQARLSAGVYPIVVTYFDNGGGDGLNVYWDGPGFKKTAIGPEFLSVPSDETVRDIAVRVLSEIPGHDAAKVTELAALMKAGHSLPAVIETLRRIPVHAWPESAIHPIADNLIGYLSAMPPSRRTSPTATDAMELAKSLSPRLTEDDGKALLQRLENLDVRVIAIGTVPARMIYDKEKLVVQAGKPVEFRLSNSDSMPHNFAIVQPGAMQEVGELAEATARDADVIRRQYIPKSNKVILGSRLLQPGETQALSFDVPSKPGVYPYVCTWPGHWRRMFGALYVVEDLDAYRAAPDTYLAEHPLTIKDSLLEMSGRNHEWTVAELSPAAKAMKHGRSFEVGRQLFKVANCMACHQLNGEGRVFGPNLAKLEPKKQTVAHILESVIEPSKSIDDRFHSWTFMLASGTTITGMIVKETNDELHVVIDPLAKTRPTVLKTDDIHDRVKSDQSLMPKGLLSRLTQEEILDLLAYVLAAGSKDHMLFHGDHHNH